MYTLRVKSHFDAAHQLKGYAGKCSRMHGHRWDWELVLQGSKLDSLNMLIDFVDVKKVMKHAEDQLDHYVLNEVLHEECPTAEYLAMWLRIQCIEALKALPGVKVSAITVWESPECSITVSNN